MPNGKRHDNPLTDTLFHGLHPFPADLEPLVVQVYRTDPDAIAYDELGAPEFDWEAGRHLPEARRLLLGLLENPGDPIARRRLLDEYRKSTGTVRPKDWRTGWDSRHVASDLHPVAMHQARSRVAVGCVIVAGFVALEIAAGFPRTAMSLLVVAASAVGTVFIGFELAWWLRWRRRTPVEAFAEIEQRPGLRGGRLQLTLSAIAVLVAFVVWWTLSR